MTEGNDEITNNVIPEKSDQAGQTEKAESEDGQDTKKVEGFLDKMLNVGIGAGN